MKLHPLAPYPWGLQHKPPELREPGYDLCGGILCAVQERLFQSFDLP